MAEPPEASIYLRANVDPLDFAYMLPARHCSVSAVFAVIMCPSVRPSVRHKPALYRLNVYRITQTTPYGSQRTLYRWKKISTKFQLSHTERGWLHFSTGWEVYGSDALPPKICVHPPRWSASTKVRWRSDTWCVSSTTLVVVNVGWSQLRSSWHQQGWLYGSLLMTRTALHARCAIVEPIATMHVCVIRTTV